MKQYFTKHLVSAITGVAITALVAAIYLTSDTAQRAARYYDPMHHTLYVRILSAAVRKAGEYGSIAVFVILFIIGTLLIIWAAKLWPRLQHWLGWSRHQSVARGK